MKSSLRRGKREYPRPAGNRLAALAAVAFLWLVLPALLPAQQSIRQLTRERERLEREVEFTQRLLNDSRGQRQRSFTELNLLNEKIALQERIVRMMEEEIEQISHEITGLGSLIGSMDRDMERYRKAYAAAARFSYLRQNKVSVLVWVLSAESFKAAFERLMYFRVFSDFRREQITLIQRTREFLMSRRADYQNQRAAKERLVAEQQRLKDKLNASKDEQADLYRNLKRQERGYQSRLREFQRSLDNLKAQIREMIEAESRRPQTQAERDRVLTLSNSFTTNKHRLPWPIPMPSAVVTGRFGPATDASGGMVYNEGLYLSTGRGQAVRTVFQGTVTMISEIPGFGHVVIVQHGNFRTVYANLEQVFVRKGQRIETLQNLGSVKTNARTGETQLYFQLYKDFTPIDPMQWLAQKQ